MNRPLLSIACHILLGGVYLLVRCFPIHAVSFLIVSVLVLFVPGLLLGSREERWTWSFLVKTMAISSAAWIVLLLVVRISGIHLKSDHAWVFIWALLLYTSVFRSGHIGGLFSQISTTVRSLPVSVILLLFMGYVVLSFSAWNVVPPQQDQDMVIANPVYGYLQHGKPFGTETHFSYIFSKPPLLHLQAGISLLFLDYVEPAYFYSQSGRIVGMLDEIQWAIRRFRQRDVECFDVNLDLVFATRAVTILLASLVPVLIYSIARRLGARKDMALLMGVSYLFMPEVFIRSGYAGFTAPSLLLLGLAAYFLSDQRKGEAATLFSVGLMMALTNQKMLFVPALFGLYVLCSRKNGIISVLRHPWLWGIAIGTGVWWAYGGAVDWSTFLRDHVYYDFRDRFLFQDVTLGYTGITWYPGISGLWMEWIRNWSPPLFVCVVGGILWGLTRAGTLRFFSLWAVLGWILGSVTDWRQTKHLMLTLIPMFVVVPVFASRFSSRVRRVFILVLLLTLFYNITVIVRVWRNFDSLPPSTVW